MKIFGVICEYNPFHNGHARQLTHIKTNGAAVCLMSGDYVQRGEPAICNKLLRAESAVRCGADLVLELPVSYSLRSAEGFAEGGVEIFDRLGCVDALSFGSESGDQSSLWNTAQMLLSEKFPEKLKEKLTLGLSFPAARQAAVEAMGGNAALLADPNDILGVEYCKALMKRNSKITPAVIQRGGSYHNSESQEAPSASVLRTKDLWQGYMPESAFALQGGAPRHNLRAGERAVLSRLRSMSEEEFAALPYGSEGLWRKLMQACRQENSVEEIVAATKSKRYTHSRLMRMIMCAFLGISEEVLTASVPYVRVLAMNGEGGKLLREMRKTSSIELRNYGENLPASPHAELERRAEALYGLFSEGETEQPLKNQSLKFYRNGD